MGGVRKGVPDDPRPYRFFIDSYTALRFLPFHHLHFPFHRLRLERAGDG